VKKDRRRSLRLATETVRRIVASELQTASGGGYTALHAISCRDDCVSATCTDRSGMGC
jgi:hypothetical protein